MRIELNNIAAMRHADIEIDGISVIAGINNTGKSTVSKTLWCMFDSFYKYEEQLNQFRFDTIGETATSILPTIKNRPVPRPLLAGQIARHINKHIGGHEANGSWIDDCILEAYGDFSRYGTPQELGYDYNALLPLREEIERIVSYPESRMIGRVIERNFQSEFGGQFCNADESGINANATLTIQEKPIVASITDNKVLSVSSPLRLNVRAIYIDDPFILDDVARGFPGYRVSRGLLDEDRHERLRMLLQKKRRDDGNVLNELMVDDLLSDVMATIENVIGSDFEYDQSGGLLYTPHGYSHSINASSISAGMKVFSMLAILLKNGSIERKSVVILDEPEVHLHPEWQLILAEVIVLLQQAFGLHVLLTTHSPYFLRAIQVYAAKHAMATRCHYYEAERTGKWCSIRDVTHSTEKIFDKLVSPFEKLEAEAMEI